MPKALIHIRKINNLRLEHLLMQPVSRESGGQGLLTVYPSYIERAKPALNGLFRDSNGAGLVRL